MYRIETNIFSKTKWGEGPWQEECDLLLTADPNTTLPILIRRTELGHLCGYVAVPSNHPWHSLDYAACTTGEHDRHCSCSPEALIEVHGGLTYSGSNIIKLEIENEPWWWFGFDCAHSFDFSPYMASQWDRKEGMYRTVDYVGRECGRLAEQLHSYLPKEPT